MIRIPCRNDSRFTDERRGYLGECKGVNARAAITARALGPSLVTSDELVGNVVEIVADNLRLRTDP